MFECFLNIRLSEDFFRQSNSLTGFYGVGANVELLAVNKYMSMRNQLTGLLTCCSKTQSVHNIVEAGFELLEKYDARVARLAKSFPGIAMQLAFQDAISKL